MARVLASLFGVGISSIDTALSMKELVDKMHAVMRHLNSLVGTHTATTDPLARGNAEREIAEKLAILQDYFIKFGKAFLDIIDRGGSEANRLMSSMDVAELFTRWPNPANSLKSYSEIIDEVIQMFRNDMYRDIKKAYVLLWFAVQVKKRKDSNIGAAKRAVAGKVAEVKKFIAAKQKAARRNIPSHENVGALPADYKKRVEAWKKMQQRQPTGARR